MVYYHIHRKGFQDELYHERSTIHFGKNSNRMWKNFLNRSGSYVESIETGPDGEEICHRRSFKTITSYDDYLKLDPEEQRKYFNYLYGFAIDSAMDFREIILEQIRRNINPNLPSRVTCAWITNKKNLDKWIELLKVKDGDYEIYKVDPDGITFSSTNELLPVDYYPHNRQIIQARRYWTPTREDITNGTREILFEGDLRLLKRVK